MNNNYISFRFERNRAIFLGDDYGPFQVRFEMRSVATKPGPLRRPSGTFMLQTQDAVAPVFFVGPDAEEQDIQRIELKSETPMVPVKPEGMADKLYERLVESAIAQVVANKAANDIVRSRLAAFVKSGTISIVEDPFKVELVAYKDRETAKTAESNHND